MAGPAKRSNHTSTPARQPRGSPAPPPPWTKIDTTVTTAVTSMTPSANHFTFCGAAEKSRREGFSIASPYAARNKLVPTTPWVPYNCFPPDQATRVLLQS